MKDKKLIRQKLAAAYEQLSPLEQALMQLLSVIYEGTDIMLVGRCVRRLESIFSAENSWHPSVLGTYIEKLYQLKLLTRKLQCHPAIVEVCTRLAIEEPVQIASGGNSERSKRAPTPQLLNRHQLMAKVVREAIPLTMESGRTGFSYERALRELRICLYTLSYDYSPRTVQEFSLSLAGMSRKSEALVTICNNPFDEEWFSKLPEYIQARILVDIFDHTLTSLEPDREALAYALGSDCFKAVPDEEMSFVYHSFVVRLIMGGRLDDAEKLVGKIHDKLSFFGIQGWLHFLRGKDTLAITSYEADLKDLRRIARKRTQFFGGLEGVFYLLALLRARNSADLEHLENLIRSAVNTHKDASWLADIYEILNAVIYGLRGETDRAREILQNDDGFEGPLCSLFEAMAIYLNDGKLEAEKIDILSELFVNSREADLDWIAMECAELLCRADEETPVRRNSVERIAQERGIIPFSAWIRAEEPWQKALRALSQIVGARPDREKTPPSMRLVWLLDYRSGVVSLKPMEQKRTVRGAWSKGRVVSLARLFGVNPPPYLSEQDKALCSTIEREGRYYYNTSYRFNLHKMLPALVGHPLVFLEKSPDIPVEITKGEPEVIVTREGDRFRIRFSLKIPETLVTMVRETPTRFKVVTFSDVHLRIARILGEKGLCVPVTAADDVMEAVAGISSHVTVHSAIGSAARHIEEIPPDPIPRLHITPSGRGMRFEMFVQPCGDKGPYLKPGQGMENLIAEIDGHLIQTRRNLKQEEELAEEVEASCPILAVGGGNDRLWQVDDPESCLQILLDLKPLQDKGELILAWPEGERLKVYREVSFDGLHMNINRKTDWFEISGELHVDRDLVIDMQRLLELMDENKQRFIPIGDGQFLALTRDLRKRLEDLNSYAEKHGKSLRIHPLTSLAIEEFTERLPHLRADQSWNERLKELHSGFQREVHVPSTLRAELREYQEEGFRWLARLAHLKLGACLADDMGLGKTLQALALVLHRAPGGPSLVVAPTSVGMNWVSEAERFAPTLNVVSLGNNGREQLVKGLGSMDVLVTSYGLLYQEAELLSSVKWQTIVLDEAQAIKNVAAKRSQAAMVLNGSFKLITTGTPIENHLSELWTLFNFINPGLLGSQKRFNERFAWPIERNGDKQARKSLKKLIQPFILRRTKAQVLEELPPGTEVVLHVEMSEEEMVFYEALRLRAVEKLDRDDSPISQKHLKILAEIMRLRQACCHPRLVVPDSSIRGAKTELFGEIVDELLENRHKALVFSQFVGYLKIIGQYLDDKKIRYLYLDGTTPPRERKRTIDAFQAGEGDLFLLTLKAGGLGLNLTAADYVIHMDPWWNPAVEDQASDRAHRIGQRRPVTVYRLVTLNTIEEKIVKLHHQKRDLAGSLLEGSDMVGKISTDELLRLIKEK